MWTRRIVSRMIAAESGDRHRRGDEHAGAPRPRQRGDLRRERPVATATSPRRARAPRWPSGVARHRDAARGRPHGARALDAMAATSHKRWGKAQGGRRLRGRPARPAGRAGARAARRPRSAGEPHRHRGVHQRAGRRAVVLGGGVGRLRRRRSSSASSWPARAVAGRRSCTRCAAGRRCRSPSPCRTSRSTTAGPGYVLAAGGIGITALVGMAQGAQGARRGLPVRLRGPHRAG